MQNPEDETDGMTSEELILLLKKSLGHACTICDREADDLIPTKEDNDEKFCPDVTQCLNRREARKNARLR